MRQDKYALALKKLQAEKDMMLPADFQQQYKKAFFETDGPSRRMTKHALAIVDPGMVEVFLSTNISLFNVQIHFEL